VGPEARPDVSIRVPGDLEPVEALAAELRAKGLDVQVHRAQPSRGDLFTPLLSVTIELGTLLAAPLVAELEQAVIGRLRKAGRYDKVVIYGPNGEELRSVDLRRK
jgi:hypothetical protein